MKIIAGTFGIKGSAFISGGQLHVESSKSASYRPEQIQSVEIAEQAENRFSVTRALIGAVMLGLLLGLVFGSLGVLSGVLIGSLGGFAAEKSNAAELEFIDGNKLRLVCTERAVNKLIRFKG